jgi:hypothetical protein
MAGTIQYALSVVVLVNLAVGPALAAEEPELGGTYIAHGVNHDGSDHQEFVQITRNGGSFVVSWILADVSNENVVLELVSVGIGIVSGKTLAVSFYGLSTAGVAAYQIEEDGRRLVGRWTTEADDGTVHTQTLTRLPDHALDPAVSAAS